MVRYIASDEIPIPPGMLCDYKHRSTQAPYNGTVAVAGLLWQQRIADKELLDHRVNRLSCIVLQIEVPAGIFLGVAEGRSHPYSRTDNTAGRRKTNASTLDVAEGRSHPYRHADYSAGTKKTNDSTLDDLLVHRVEGTEDQIGKQMADEVEFGGGGGGGGGRGV